MTLVKQIQQGGLTLLEVMVVVMMTTIMLLMVYPILHHYILQTRLYEAQQSMLDNVMELERYYARHFSYRYLRNWVTLRHNNTKYFCIRMQGNPKSINADKFTMKAVAFNKEDEPRVLLINQDHRMLVCDSSESSCAENKDFFQNHSRVDKNCTTI